MKRRRILVVALSISAVTASGAYASALEPATGAWKGSATESSEAVTFKLVKSGDSYRAASTQASVVAPCKAPNPEDSSAVRTIRARGVTVKLGSDGKRLRGTRTLVSKPGGGKATQKVTIAVRFLSERRAKGVVKASYVTKRKDPKSNSDDCSGRLTVTAKPK